MLRSNETHSFGVSLSQEQSDYGYSVQKGEFNYSNACKWEDMG